MVIHSVSRGFLRCFVILGLYKDDWKLWECKIMFLIVGFLFDTQLHISLVETISINTFWLFLVAGYIQQGKNPQMSCLENKILVASFGGTKWGKSKV